MCLAAPGCVGDERTSDDSSSPASARKLLCRYRLRRFLISWISTERILAPVSMRMTTPSAASRSIHVIGLRAFRNEGLEKP